MITVKYEVRFPAPNSANGMEVGQQKVKQRGWWATHPYPKRRSVEDIVEFVGWQTLESIVNACEKQTYDSWRFKAGTKQRNFIIKRDKSLIVTSFLTGGRVNEVLDLKAGNFDLASSDEYIIVKDMLLEKVWKYETLDNPVFVTVREYKNMGYKERRYFNLESIDGNEMYVKSRVTRRNTALSIRNDFPIHRKQGDEDTPFVKDILEPWIQRHDKDEYLFASNDIRREGKPITSTRAYQIIMNVARICNVNIWPHWFRAQRASQLFKEWNLSWEELKLWFAWRTDVMAQRYARISVDELASRMQRKRNLLTQR